MKIITVYLLTMLFHLLDYVKCSGF